MPIAYGGVKFFDAWAPAWDWLAWACSARAHQLRRAPAPTSAPAAAAKPTTAPAGANAAPPAPTAAAAAKPTSAPAAAAKPAASGGKAITIGEWQQVAIMNTLMTSEGGNVTSGTKLALRGLLFTDEKGAPNGELATDVPSTQNGGISADGKTITYKLRPNVTWHDGQPVTSADVQYTWQAIMQPDHNVATRYGYDRIDAVDVPDPQTAVVRFKAPFAPWATLFDVVLPQHILAQQSDFNGSPYHQKPVGFGPFKVAENIKGDHTTYEAFDGYWRSRPKIDRLFIRYFGNTDAELQALKAKEIDLAWGVPLSSIPELKDVESQGITTLVQPGPAQERYTFNMDHTQAPLFADKELRRALVLSVDRKTIVDKLLFGLTKIARGDWDNTPWENTSIGADAFDPAQAKTILDGLGWTPGSGRHADEGRPAPGVRQHHDVRQSIARERAAPGPAELQRRRRRDEHQEHAQRTSCSGRMRPAACGRAATTRWAAGPGLALNRIRIMSARYLAKEIPSDANPAGAQQYRYSNPEIDELFGAGRRRAGIRRTEGDLLQDPGSDARRVHLDLALQHDRCLGHADEGEEFRARR